MQLFQSSLKITKAGFIYTGLTIFLGVSAVNTGNNFLYFLLSILLSFMWLSGLFARLNLASLKIEIYPPSEAYAGRRSIFKIKCRKSLGWGFLYRIKISFERKEDLEEIFIKIPYFYKEIEASFAFTPRKRGLYVIKEIELSSPFPMALFERKKNIQVGQRFVVFPEPKNCHLFEREKRERKEGQSGGLVLGSEEFYSISDYLAGIPKKLIYWKAWAKWEELKRKVYLEGQSPLLLIDLDKLPIVGLEDKISCATFLILKAILKGEAVGLKLGNVSYPPQRGEAHKLKLLTALSLYEGKEAIT